MSTQDLQAAYETALEKAQKLMADKDAAITAIRAKYTAKLQAANDDAAAAHKAWLTAEAIDGLAGRDDREEVARSLGLTIPTE